MVASLFALIQSPAPICPQKSWLNWVRYPIERNAPSCLPKVDTPLLSVAIVPDGQHIIAVGNNGSVLTSADGGNTWASKTVVDSNDLQSVAIAPPMASMPSRACAG